MQNDSVHVDKPVETSTDPRLIDLLERIKAMPIRREPIGGQYHSYLNRDEVIAWIELAAVASHDSPATPPVIAWQHELRPYEVCSEELKQVWLGAKPSYVKHYTIPLCRSSAAQAAANKFFGEFYKNKYELWIAATKSAQTAISERAYRAIHILRNRHGWSDEQIRDAGLTLAKEYEDMKDAYENMRDFARSKGLDTTAYSSDYFQSGVNPDSPQAT